MRTRIVLAALLFSPVLAQAQGGVTLYGVFDAYAGSARSTANGDAARSNAVINSGGLTTSYWGIKGSEKLDGGLSAVFAVEGFFRGDTGESGRRPNDPLFARSAFVGLQGAFGRLTVGRQTTLLYASAGKFNPFGTSTPFSPTVMQLYRPLGSIYASAPLAGDTKWSNTVRYSAPLVAGVHADAMYQASETSGANGGHNRGYAASLARAFGKLQAGAAYQRLNLQTAGDGHEQQAWNASVAYAVHGIKPYLQWYRIRDRFNDTVRDLRHNIVVAGASVGWLGGRVLAAYGHTATSYGNPALAAARRNTWSLGYDYPLSRRTDVYAALKRDRAHRGALHNSDELLGVGMRHAF